MNIRRILSALLTGLAGAAALAAPAQAAGQAQAPSDRLQVWNLNTRHMTTNAANCTDRSPCTDYREFVHYITDPARAAYVPDLVTLQEAGTNVTGLTTPSCRNVEYTLEARTGLDYYCYETGTRGGSAVVYRTGRLSFTGGERDVPLKHRASAGAACTASSWTALVQRFQDDVNGKFVTVASVHLPYSPDNADADCAWENTKTLDTAVDDLGAASMRIMAGDWNNPDGTLTAAGTVDWACWYSGTTVDLGTCGSTVGNLGWKDAMYRACGLTGTAAFTCLRGNHATLGGSRIDFLFTKAYAIYAQDTVDFTEAWQSAGGQSTLARQYSDHRGQGAQLRYY